MLDSEELLILTLVPIVALIFNFIKKKQIVFIIVSIAVIISLPAFGGYDFILSWLYEVCALIVIGGIMSFTYGIADKFIPKLFSSIILSCILFVIFGYFALLHAFSGSSSSIETIKFDAYTVELIESRGFAGGSLFYYELHHKPFSGLFDKNLGKGYIKDKEECLTTFKNSTFKFNSCNKQLVK